MCGIYLLWTEQLRVSRPSPGLLYWYSDLLSGRQASIRLAQDLLALPESLGHRVLDLLGLVLQVAQLDLRKELLVEIVLDLSEL